MLGHAGDRIVQSPCSATIPAAAIVGLTFSRHIVSSLLPASRRAHPGEATEQWWRKVDE